MLASRSLLSGHLRPFYLGAQPVFREEVLEVSHKFTGDLAFRVSLAGAADVDVAIQKAFDARAACQAFPIYMRKKVLGQCIQGFQERFEELAQTLCVEAGKPLKDARGEVTRLIDTFEIAKEECSRLYGEYADMDLSERNAGFKALTRRFPCGVVSMISPFNFPLNLVAHKVAPAIAAGCPFVLKPASQTPVTALILGEILSACPLPAGSWSILPSSRQAADLLTTDQRVSLLSFTGSPGVGWDLKARAGQKRVTLELGGNAACVIDSLKPQADLDALVDRLVFGGYYQSGQSCVHLQRLYIHDDLYDTLLAKLVQRVSSLKVGHPQEEDTFVGPVISSKDASRIESWVQEAQQAGGQVHCGGQVWSDNSRVISPALLTEVPETAMLMSEEVFGPVMCVSRFSDFPSLVRHLNSGKYGIHVGLYTQSLDKAFYGFEHLETGGVIINDIPSMRSDAQPYGGVKESGLGREGVKYAMEDMTELKVMMLKDVGKTC